MSGTILDIVELLLTAEIYKRYPELDVNDLPKNIRKNYWNSAEKTVPKPIRATFLQIEKLYGIQDIEKFVRNVPFINIDKSHFELNLSAFELAAEWFEKQEGSLERIENNPVLAYYFGEIRKVEAANYAHAKAKIRPKEVDREWIESLVAEIRKEDKGEEMLRLVVIIAPEDVKQKIRDLVLTEEQKNEVEKIMKAIQHREYLREIGLHDIGKLLFVGPPGTGKTSVARALSERLSIPFVEVKLSMITDQYLGETAKNIDRVFLLAKKLNPCILFIDELDFVAKARTSDENAAIKRAVNTLLKAIDEISLVEHGVLLIAATNHPRMLDSAAWRRFDEIVHFPLPDFDMRKNILDIVTQHIEGDFNTEEIAELTEGYSGSDLRMVIREAVLSALLEERKVLTQEDLLAAVRSFDERSDLKSEEYDRKK
ncbi:AAA+-type ATPase, SpoVK/Ycf46/Vps4 family [Methanosarcina thermophila]|jgi:SpoVK/Ycf46/Vps4 family AAA+-type ATPase|uniref:AAA family ATPase n=3 Tax=Methanosarcina thermophila TaxID=2210 RepID=A0A1I6XAX6_METTE|nr:ATP-binding protein [Methanosarcina thermophila]ALK04573.1 MAG: ATPase AAA [Methanosarcina sp. 795]AKB13233.1 AAA family ATPase [Methanosarcina thermophila TM-1]AKB16132.1 AAA family ATPase [Methanosarcina thermophila CHTI-55]NLU57194.1 ATP-binding protein [Methanosarcina thermophila]SFT34994.1 AAA+-type ATPase, SpoVK/Ycf46/Vps4 family [Methanosarcina thermophila]